MLSLRPRQARERLAAFALPLLQHLGAHGALRCLVLEPTRELAMQVETSIRDLARMTDLRIASLYGGVGYGAQREAMKRGLDVIVATPGRLEDYLAQGILRLDGLEIVVLDEVDRMLDVGFLPAVKRILSQCPSKRQTLFFSATLPPEIAELAAWALSDPTRVEIGAGRPVAAMVTHGVYSVEAERKFDLLVALLEATDYQSVLVFARTKHGADKIAKKLRNANHAVAVLHANRTHLRSAAPSRNELWSGKWCSSDRSWRVSRDSARSWASTPKCRSSPKWWLRSPARRRPC